MAVDVFGPHTKMDDVEREVVHALASENRRMWPVFDGYDCMVAIEEPVSLPSRHRDSEVLDLFRDGVILPFDLTSSESRAYLCDGQNVARPDLIWLDTGGRHIDVVPFDVKSRHVSSFAQTSAHNLADLVRKSRYLQQAFALAEREYGKPILLHSGYFLTTQQTQTSSIDQFVPEDELPLGPWDEEHFARPLTHLTLMEQIRQVKNAVLRQGHFPFTISAVSGSYGDGTPKEFFAYEHEQGIETMHPRIRDIDEEIERIAGIPAHQLDAERWREMNRQYLNELEDRHRRLHGSVNGKYQREARLLEMLGSDDLRRQARKRAKILEDYDAAREDREKREERLRAVHGLLQDQRTAVYEMARAAPWFSPVGYQQVELLRSKMLDSLREEREACVHKHRRRTKEAAKASERVQRFSPIFPISGPNGYAPHPHIIYLDGDVGYEVVFCTSLQI